MRAMRAGVVAGLAAALVLACDATPTGTVDEVLPIATSSRQVASPVPIHGDFTWHFNGWMFPEPGRCPDDGTPWVLSTGFGTGTMAHLGRVRVTDGGHCVDPFTFAFVHGEVTLVAANGDELHATYSGTGFPGPQPNEVGWIDELVFEGGTGRFANASGGAVETGGATLVFDPATGLVSGGEGWSTMEGTIIYDASARRHD